MNDEILEKDTEAEKTASETISKDSPAPEYSKEEIDELLFDDLAELTEEFPELSGTKNITDIRGATRYAALRDMGLSPREAYLATLPKAQTDTRAHLHIGVPARVRAPLSSMTVKELYQAREIFGDLDDREIERLYRKVTK